MKNKFIYLMSLVSLITLSGCKSGDQESTSKSTGTSSSEISYVSTSSSVITELIEQKVTLKKAYKGRIVNATIEVYKDDKLVDSAVTNTIGNASFEIKAGKYTLKLKNLPAGIVAEDSYSVEFDGKDIEIVCDTEVIDEEAPDNHTYLQGDIMYNYTFTDFDDNTTSLKSIFDEEGKDLVIFTFFASWCGPCRSEFPYFNDVDKIYGDRVKVVGFDSDWYYEDTDDVIEEFKDFFNVTWTIARGLHVDFFSKFNAAGIPLTIFINKYGIIDLMHNAAYATSDAMLNDVDECLNKLD